MKTKTLRWLGNVRKIPLTYPAITKKNWLFIGEADAAGAVPLFMPSSKTAAAQA